MPHAAPRTDTAGTLLDLLTPILFPLGRIWLALMMPTISAVWSETPWSQDEHAGGGTCLHYDIMLAMMVISYVISHF